MCRAKLKEQMEVDVADNSVEKEMEGQEQIDEVETPALPHEPPAYECLQPAGEGAEEM